MEDKLNKRLAFRISNETRYKLDKLKKEKFINYGRLFRKLLDDYLDKQQ